MNTPFKVSMVVAGAVGLVVVAVYALGPGGWRVTAPVQRPAKKVAEEGKNEKGPVGKAGGEVGAGLRLPEEPEVLTLDRMVEPPPRPGTGKAAGVASPLIPLPAAPELSSEIPPVPGKVVVRKDVPATQPAVARVDGPATTRPAEAVVKADVPATQPGETQVMTFILGTGGERTPGWGVLRPPEVIERITGVWAGQTMTQEEMRAAMALFAEPVSSSNHVESRSGSGAVSTAAVVNIAGSATEVGRNYTVKVGDTLSSIAKEQLGRAMLWSEIVKANPGMNPNAVKVGQVIRLPAVGGSQGAAHGVVSAAVVESSGTTWHTVGPGESLWSIAKQHYQDGNLWNVVYDANRGVIGENRDVLKAGVRLVIPARAEEEGSH